MSVASSVSCISSYPVSVVSCYPVSVVSSYPVSFVSSYPMLVVSIIKLYPVIQCQKFCAAIPMLTGYVAILVRQTQELALSANKDRNDG